MTSDRPYRRALTVDAARAEIRIGLGSQFCPRAGGALLDITQSRSQPK
jgi:HD-GYP domain-containing protein (c-di-GMP phosphodiesterase class II)